MKNIEHKKGNVYQNMCGQLQAIWMQSVLFFLVMSDFSECVLFWLSRLHIIFMLPEMEFIAI